MNWTQISIGVLFVVIGFLTYLFRNSPNPYIGVRLGYTYLSNKAWKKANTFAAFYCILFGLLLTLFALTLHPPNSVFVLTLIVGIVPLTIVSYRIAKKAYEMDDTRTPAIKIKSKVDTKKYLTVQLVLIAAYLTITILCWNRIPSVVAIHFNIYGIPDNFADKITGTIIMPIAVMCIIPIITFFVSKEPMILRFPIDEKGQRQMLTFLTFIQAFIFSVLTTVLLYNAKIVSIGTWFIFIVLGFVVFMIVWIYFVWRHYRFFKF